MKVSLFGVAAGGVSKVRTSSDPYFLAPAPSPSPILTEIEREIGGSHTYFALTFTLLLLLWWFPICPCPVVVRRQWLYLSPITRPPVSPSFLPFFTLLLSLLSFPKPYPPPPHLLLLMLLSSRTPTPSPFLLPPSPPSARSNSILLSSTLLALLVESSAVVSLTWPSLPLTLSNAICRCPPPLQIYPNFCPLFLFLT